MEDDHEVVLSKTSKNTNSIFNLFANLTGEKNQNPKFCAELIKSLRGSKFDVGSGNSFDYSLKRIVRGLGSIRLHSQCGCFASLTCLLKYKVCSAEDVLEVLEKERHRTSGATKAEIKALNVQRVLASGAVVNSGLLGDSPENIQEVILKNFVEAGLRKNYLATVTVRFLVDVVTQSESRNFKSVIWSIVKTSFEENLNDCNQDSFHLLLVCLKKYPKTVNKFLQKILHSRDFFEKKVVEFLMNNNVNNDHPVYENIGELFSKNLPSKITFWQDCTLENAKNGFHKSDTLLTIFMHILNNMSEVNYLPELLTSEFIEIFLKVLSYKRVKNSKDENNSTIAKSALNSMVNLLCTESTSDAVRFAVIKKLLFYPSNMKFDAKTGTKCVYTLTSNLSSNYIKDLLKIYKSVISGESKKTIDKEGTEEIWNSKEKQYALHTFTKILNHPSLRRETNWKLDQIKFLFHLGFIKKNELISELQKCAKTNFYKAIMVQMPSLKDLVLLLDDLVLYLNENIKNKSIKLNDDVITLWDKIFDTVSLLKNNSKNKLFIAVHVLLIYMGFYIFQDVELSKNGVEELLSCYERLKEIHDKKKSEGQKGPHWTEVTVDLMLSLLSRENKLWRHVISCIFSQTVSHITPAALNQIIEALDPKSENNVLRHLDSDESESEADDRDSSDSSSSESEENEMDDDEVDEKENDRLRMAVRSALGYGETVVTDEESVDMDQMDEEEEKRLNERLGQAFSLFKRSSGGKKKKQSKEEEAVTHFRLRVLDLVDKYTSNSPSMEGCLGLVLPLLDLLETSIKDPFQRALQNKVDSILKGISTVKSFSNADDVDQTVIKTLFQAIVDKREIPSLVFVEMSPRIADCATFLVKCSQQIPKADEEVPLADEYDSLLKAFFLSRDFKLPISIFQAVLRISWKGNFKLVGTLFELLAASNIRIFKKMKAIELLRIFYKNENLHENAGERCLSQLNAIETRFINDFLITISENDEAAQNFTEKMHLSYFSHIIMLINLIKATRKKHGCQGKKFPPWEKLIVKLSEIDAVYSNKKTRAQLSNLAKTFEISLPLTGISAGTKKKDRKESKKVEPEMESEPEDPPKKKKRKMEKIKEGRKQKKESRKMREEISSKGLEDIKFSSFDLRSIPISEEED